MGTGPLGKKATLMLCEASGYMPSAQGVGNSQGVLDLKCLL